MSDTKTVQRITHKYSIFTRTVFYNKHEYKNLLNKKIFITKFACQEKKGSIMKVTLKKKSFLCSLSSILKCIFLDLDD